RVTPPNRLKSSVGPPGARSSMGYPQPLVAFVFTFARRTPEPPLRLRDDGAGVFFDALAAFGRGEREPEVEGRAVAEVALDPDVPAVALDEVPDQPETEAGPFDAGHVRAFHSEETGEHPIQSVRRDAHALVLDTHLDALLVGQLAGARHLDRRDL